MMISANASAHNNTFFFLRSLRDRYNGLIVKHMNEADQFTRYANIAKGVRIACYVLAVISFITDVMAVISYFTTEIPPEAEVPHHLMTAVDTPYGTDYVYYETVKDQDGNAGDMNHHEGSTEVGWLVLYSTKDPNAGDPILAKELEVQTGNSAVSGGKTGVHLFNETGVLNVTAKNYTGTDDKVNGTYILFTRAAGYEGTILNNGILALIGGGALMIGLAGGFFLAKGLKKKEEII